MGLNFFLKKVKKILDFFLFFIYNFIINKKGDATMVEITEIKAADEKACNCCRTRDSDKKYYDVSFIKTQKGSFTSGVHIKLCENCIEELFDKTMEIVLQGKTIEQS